MDVNWLDESKSLFRWMRLTIPEGRERIWLLLMLRHVKSVSRQISWGREVSWLDESKSSLRLTRSPISGGMAWSRLQNNSKYRKFPKRPILGDMKVRLWPDRSKELEKVCSAVK